MKTHLNFIVGCLFLASLAQAQTPVAAPASADKNAAPAVSRSIDPTHAHSAVSGDAAHAQSPAAVAPAPVIKMNPVASPYAKIFKELSEEEVQRFTFTLRLNAIDAREIQKIQWPTEEETIEGLLEKFEPILGGGRAAKLPEAELKKQFHEYCTMRASNYEKAINRNLKLKAGYINLTSICDGVTSVLDRSYILKTLENDEMRKFLDGRFDSYVYAFYISPAYKLAAEASHAEGGKLSLYSMIGIPSAFHTIINQVLILLALALSGFSAVKILRD